MASKQQSKVTADLKKNRLCIALGTTATKAELNKVYTDIRFCVADLKPGFDVITDLSLCTLGHLNAIATFKKIMDYLVAQKVGRVVRVVGGTNIAFRQLLALATRFHCYKPLYVASLEEAETVLQHPVAPEALSFQLHRRQVDFVVGQAKGQGQLVDISTGGCTVQGTADVVAKDQEMALTLVLNRQKDDKASFTLDARVVSVAEDRFAVEFLNMADAEKDGLYQCLVYEVRRDMVA